MATLLINDIPDEDMEALNALARRDNVTVEEVAIRAIRYYTNLRRSELEQISRADLLLAAEGIQPFTDEQLKQYKNEGRE